MSDPTAVPPSRGLFPWACLIVAAAPLAFLGWAVNDLRLEARRLTAALNEQLPPILDNGRRTSESVGAVAADVKQLRELLGLSDKGGEIGLAAFAAEVLTEVEKSGGVIGLKPVLIGSKLKDTRPAREWVADARKEAVWLTFRVRTKREMLEKLSHNYLGSAWWIEVGDAKVVPLTEWLGTRRPEWKAPAAGEK
jgi:hypothetical protein